MQHLSNDQFNAILDGLIDTVQSTAQRDKTDAFPPVLILYQLKLPPITYVLDTESFEQRHQLLFDCGRRRRREGMQVTAAFFISEAWMAIANTETPPDRLPIPSQDPERQEVLVVAGMTVDGRSNGAMLQIRRDGNNLINLGKMPLRFPASEKQNMGTYMANNLIVHFFKGYSQATSSPMVRRPVTSFKNRKH